MKFVQIELHLLPNSVASEFKILVFFVKEFRDKVICKKQIYLERSTVHRVWAISGVERKRERERESALKYGAVSFYELCNFVGL